MALGFIEAEVFFVAILSTATTFTRQEPVVHVIPRPQLNEKMECRKVWYRITLGLDHET